MTRESASYTWQNLLHGGFAFDRAPFATHPTDADFARKMVYQSKYQRIPLREILAETRRYLTEKGVLKSNINEFVENVKSFYQSITFQKTKKRAWVVYWQGTEASFQPQDVIAIFDSRKSASSIEAFIHAHYIATTASLGEKLHYSSHPQDIPYPVEYHRTDGIKWEGCMHCGHNPHIVGRIVANMVIMTDSHGTESIHWQNLLPPHLPHI